MGNPVVHFDINGPDLDGLMTFYSELFGWKLQPFPELDYALVDTDSGEGALRGGLGSTGATGTIVYVQVPDIDAHLERAKAAVATVMMERTESPQVTLAIFQDPQGNIVGLVEG